MNSSYKHLITNWWSFGINLTDVLGIADVCDHLTFSNFLCMFTSLCWYVFALKSNRIDFDK